MLPKKLSTGVRYLSSSAFNIVISIVNPNAGQAADGTPNPPTTVATNIHANVAPWRSREIDDKDGQRVGVSAYKVTIWQPKTYSIDSGMQLQIQGRNRTLNIESIQDSTGEGIQLVLWCWESQATS